VTNKLTVQVIAAVVVGVFALGIWASGERVSAGWLRFYSLAVLAAVVVLAAWEHWLWKWGWFQKIPKVRRNVSGTWKGRLASLWVDPETGEQIPAKDAYLVVRQTASTASVTLLTDESRSKSSLAVVSSLDGDASLDYAYLNKPDVHVDHRSHMHHGSTSLHITGRPATRLKGRYWTDRDTKGELDFTKRNEKKADDYEQAVGLF
jgi:hypothetical protein